MKKIILILVVAISSLTTNAQTKTGYINSQELMSSLPETKIIDSTLINYQIILEKHLNILITDFNNQNQSFIKDSSSLLTSIKEAKRKSLYEQAESIKTFKEQAERDLNAQRDSLVKPLFSKVKDAINAVAKEHGYDYIIDISSNNVLFYNEKYNIIQLVKKKLK